MAFEGLSFTVPAQYQGLILLASRRWGIDANILAAQLEQESGFNPRAVSSAGAEGIAQFEPGTAASIGVNPWNPASAIDGMAHLDSEYVREFGSIELALAAYNAGPGSIHHGQIPAIPETQNYVSKILRMAGNARPSPGSSTTGTPASLGGVVGGFENIGHVIGDILNPSWWARVGKGALGVGVIIVGAYFMMQKEPGSLKPVKQFVNMK